MLLQKSGQSDVQKPPVQETLEVKEIPIDVIETDKNNEKVGKSSI